MPCPAFSSPGAAFHAMSIYRENAPAPRETHVGGEGATGSSAPEPATTGLSSGVAPTMPHPPDSATAFSWTGATSIAMSVYWENA